MRAVVLMLAVASATAGISCRYYRLELRGQRLAHADVLVVPGYRLTDAGEATALLVHRISMAKILLDNGYAPRMIVTGGMPRNGVTEAERMRDLAVGMGIPKHRIILEPKARNSVENARFSAEIADAMGFRSGLVVSDPAQLFYAVPVFRDAFEAYGMALYWTPVDYVFLEHTERGARAAD